MKVRLWLVILLTTLSFHITNLKAEEPKLGGEKKAAPSKEDPHDDLLTDFGALTPEQQAALKKTIGEQAKANRTKAESDSEFDVPKNRILRTQNPECKQSHSLLLLSLAGNQLKEIQKNLATIQTRGSDEEKVEKLRLECLKLENAMSLADSIRKGVIAYKTDNLAGDLGPRDPFFQALSGGYNSAKEVRSQCEQLMQNRVSQLSYEVRDKIQPLVDKVGEYKKNLLEMMTNAKSQVK